jgi:polyvinyl alcohol dehydrogenase (cytochrome)
MRDVRLSAVVLAVLGVPVLSAQDGAAIYKERCASCHDQPEGRVPALSAIKAMTGEAVFIALTNGKMKTQAEGLSTAQIFSLLTFIAPTGGAPAAAPSLTRTCPADAPFRTAATAPRWGGWSPSVTNARFQNTAAAGMSAADVPKLKLKWAFNLGGVTIARSQPTVAGGRVFIATVAGPVYSIDAKSGCTYWGFKTDSGVRSGMTLGEANGAPALYFGDQGSNIYALSAETGKLLWKMRAAEHFATMITAAPQYRQGVVYVAHSSFEEILPPDPKYQCCTFRGLVVALDAATGKQIWKSYTIPDAPQPTKKSPAGTQLHGPSGAGVWSTPTIDERLGVLYVATGDNYSDPPSKTSDAVLAMSLKTGEIAWSSQLTPNDAFNVGCGMPTKPGCPDSNGPDFDFGQPPILVNLEGGGRALVIGQKSGMVHAIDPDKKGAVLWQTRVGKGSALGGSQWGSAADNNRVYVAVSDIGIENRADPSSPTGFRSGLKPNEGGGLHALRLKTGQIAWSTKPDACPASRGNCSPAQSAAVTVIPGVVFSGSVDGHLRGYSTETGKIVWDFDTAREYPAVNGGTAKGGSLDVAGPAIVNGMLYVNSGYGQWGGMPGNVLLAFSVDGK